MMCHKIRVSARAVIIHNDAILLNCFGDGAYYNFPGGGIEPNETAKQAVVREVLEETGLTVHVGELVFVSEFEPSNCAHDGDECHHIGFFFRCRVNDSIVPAAITQPDVSPQDETWISTARWVGLSDLKSITLVPRVGEPLIQYIKTGQFSPLFWAEWE